MDYRSSMLPESYAYRSHTPGQSRGGTLEGLPARPRRAGDALHEDLQQLAYRAEMRPRRTEDSPYEDIQQPAYRSHTPGSSGRGTEGGHVRRRDQSPELVYTSSVPPGRSSTLENHSRSRHTDTVPYDDFNRLSLATPRPASRSANYRTENPYRNTRPGVAFEDGLQYSPPQYRHRSSSRPAAHLRSRSTAHGDQIDRRAERISPDFTTVQTTQRFAEYDHRREGAPEHTSHDHRRDSPRTQEPQDYRGRPARRASVNENLRPARPTSLGPIPRGDHPRRDTSRGGHSSSRSGPVPRGQRPDFIIVGLFVLRLARRLISQLSSYPEKPADLAWLDSFLSSYPADADLAELRGVAIDEFAKTNPVIINHFIKQPEFPVVFMQMNPTPRDVASRRLSDREARDMVDFADAAAEWGSDMKLPGCEKERMERLAAGRKIAR